jgi:hypothetical protein
LRQAALGPTYAVLYGRVNLLVDRVVSCPAGSHLALLKKISVQKPNTGGKWVLLKPDVPNDPKPPDAPPETNGMDAPILLIGIDVPKWRCV